jgi:predicted metal-dependent hydrolase
MNYEINVQRQKRNNLVLRLSPGTMDILIPNWLEADSPQVQQFIAKGIERYGDKVPPKTEHELCKAEIFELVDQWAKRIGVQPRRVQMRTMYRKWGSCSRRGTITLDTALCHVPLRLVEYMICHELVHLIEFNHGEGFRNLMSLYMPDWEERKRELTGLTGFRN